MPRRYVMVAAPAGQLLVSAVSLLDQGRGIDRLSRLLTAAALIAPIGIAVWGVYQPVPVSLVALSVLAGVVEVYLAIRVGFDAALFRHLADAAETGTRDLANLDAALMAIGLVPASKPAVRSKRASPALAGCSTSRQARSRCRLRCSCSARSPRH